MTTFDHRLVQKTHLETRRCDGDELSPTLKRPAIEGRFADWQRSEWERNPNKKELPRYKWEEDKGLHNTVRVDGRRVLCENRATSSRLDQAECLVKVQLNLKFLKRRDAWLAIKASCEFPTIQRQQGNNFIENHEFAQAVRKVLAGALVGVSDEELDQIVARWDENSNGRITYNEFCCALNCEKHSVPDETALAGTSHIPKPGMNDRLFHQSPEKQLVNNYTADYYSHNQNAQSPGATRTLQNALTSTLNRPQVHESFLARRTRDCSNY